MIKVAVIEDQPEIREGLAELICTSQGFRCTGKYGSMEQALRWIERDPPNIVLVDIGLPEMSGIEGIRRLKQRYPEILCLVLSVYEDDDRIFDALQAGACGYLLKKTPPDRLLEGLRAAMAGGSPISPEIARRVITLFQQIRPAHDADYDLTAQEVKILKLLVDGHNYKTAAAKLDISVNTVCFHIRNIYEKLQVHSKSEAVARALKLGLIKL